MFRDSLPFLGPSLDLPSTFPESISHLLPRDDWALYLKIFSRSRSEIGDGGTIFHPKMRERKVSGTWRVTQTIDRRSTIHSPRKTSCSSVTPVILRLIGTVDEKGSNGTAAGGPRQAVRVQRSRHVASSAAACASLRRNRCTASTALVSWRPGKCGCGCGAESMPPATLPDQRIGRAARGSRAGWKTAESRRRATPVGHVDCRRDIRVCRILFFRMLRFIKLLSRRLSSSYSSNKAQTRDYSFGAIK